MRHPGTYADLSMASYLVLELMAWRVGKARSGKLPNPWSLKGCQHFMWLNMLVKARGVLARSKVETGQICSEAFGLSQEDALAFKESTQRGGRPGRQGQQREGPSTVAGSM